MHGPRRTIFLCPSWIRCWIDLQERGGTVFLMVIIENSIASEDQEKTTFTCPYGTFAFKRMSFGLCSASATFQMYNLFESSLDRMEENIVVITTKLVKHLPIHLVQEAQLGGPVQTR
uniref:Uncharacterized protein n=1 Tax=Solanum lycopersicum TaxID=4081 RepID=A0A3Q7G2D4_SOLLC